MRACGIFLRETFGKLWIIPWAYIRVYYTVSIYPCVLYREHISVWIIPWAYIRVSIYPCVLYREHISMCFIPWVYYVFLCVCVCLLYSSHIFECTRKISATKITSERACWRLEMTQCTHILTSKHAYICTHTLTRMDLYARTHAYILYTHTHTHACIHLLPCATWGSSTRIVVCMHVYIHTYIHIVCGSYKHHGIHTCIQTYVDTYTHAYISHALVNVTK
jgi:hypothetical protein